MSEGDQFNKFIIISALTIALVMPVFVSAGSGAGLTPNSPFYFLDTFSEKISLFFTFNPAKKVRKALSYAEERLAETEVLIDKNKSELVERAMSGYKQSFNLATEKAKKIEDENEANAVLTSITEESSKHQQVLTAVYNKVSDEAKVAIERALEVSIRVQEEAFEQIAELKTEVKELKQKIVELEQQKQSEQSKEIEILRQELEALKRQRSIQIAQPKVVEKVIEKIVEVSPPTSKGKVGKELTNREIIEEVKPSVVFISNFDGSSGSGMIIESNGIVLTNAHVVQGVNTTKVKLSNGRLFVGNVVGRDENIDLAVIKIDVTELPVVELGDSDFISQGDEVFTLGYPFGLEGDVSFKEGTISRRVVTENIDYLEISADILPGNSGGPLVNKFGQVVGINTAVLPEASLRGIALGETLKFSIPVNIARALIPDLKAGRLIIDEEAKAKKVEEQRREEEARAKKVEERRRIEEENKRLEAEILITKQCIQRKQSTVTEYNTKKLTLEQRIADRKAKYYSDYDALTESFKGRGVTRAGVQGQYDALLREANRDIELWVLELDKLYVEYSTKLNQLQC